MFPLLLSPLLTAVTSVASGAGSLALGAVKTAAKAVSATGDAIDDSGTVTDKKGKEWDADSPQGKTVAAAQAKEEEAPKDLFGGLDLAKVKSAIDDKGPMGPEEEGPKTVYKQMIKQLQNISSTLLRMEETLRMLLSIEYERIQGMIKQDRDTTLEVGDTDTDSTEKGRGILGRGKDMLGGAYSKIKGGLSGTFGKLLGLGALIIAFKKYPEEIKLALEKVLKYFSDVYNVFKEEGFGEALKKVVDDFKNIAYPKIKEVVLGILDSLWSMIKGAAMEWLFGASGDKKISQDRLKKQKGVTTLTEMKETLLAKGVDLEKESIGGASGQFFGLQGLTEGTTLDKKDSKRLDEAINRTLQAMRDITKETDGRVQWRGFPDLRNPNTMGELTGVSINRIIEATPQIDGFNATQKQLDDFRLYASAGVTRETSEADRELIFENLAEMTKIRRVLEKGPNNDGLYSGPGIKGWQTKEAVLARFEELKADNKLLGQYSQEEIAEMSGAGFSSTVVGTAGTTTAQTDLKVTGTNRWTPGSGGTVNVTTVAPVDASQKVVSNENINVALQAKNIEFTQYQLARLNNGLAVSGF